MSKMDLTFEDFLKWEETDYDSIKVKRIYIDIAEDLVAGLLLSQIIYWHLPSKKDGMTRLRVKKDDKLWLAKSREDWWDECRITPRQFDRAINILVDKGLVEKQRFRFDGSPTIHIRLIPDRLMEEIGTVLDKYTQREMDISESAIDKHEQREMDINESVKSKLTKCEDPSLQKSDIHLNEISKTLTETTPEITTETTTLNTYALESACDSTRVSPNDHDKQEKPRKPFRSLKQQQRFDAFWESYPRKRSKGQAEKTWVKLNPNDDLLEEILTGLENAKNSIDWQKDGGQYIPYPSTWLNAKGWEDELPAMRDSPTAQKNYDTEEDTIAKLKRMGVKLEPCKQKIS